MGKFTQVGIIILIPSFDSSFIIIYVARRHASLPSNLVHSH